MDATKLFCIDQAVSFFAEHEGTTEDVVNMARAFFEFLNEPIKKDNVIEFQPKGVN